MINLALQAETVGELHAQMREFLAGTSIGTVVSPPLAPTADVEQPKRQTAAEKKAAKEAADKAAAEAAAADAAKAPPTEIEKQDAKDEAADKPAEPEAIVFNHDSVRKMLGGYVMAYGMESAQADGPGMIGVKLISELPDDQANFAKVILSIASAMEKNPNKREIAGDGITADKLAELKPFVLAAKALLK